jgi:hypothetical protein
MGIVAVLCVNDDYINKVISRNLQRQSWELHTAHSSEEAISLVRNLDARVLIVANDSISPMSPEELTTELIRDPVKVINLDVKSPQPPSIFANPKGPLPPAIAVRPSVWLGRSLHVK